MKELSEKHKKEEEETISTEVDNYDDISIYRFAIIIVKDNKSLKKRMKQEVIGFLEKLEDHLDSYSNDINFPYAVNRIMELKDEAVLDDAWKYFIALTYNHTNIAEVFKIAEILNDGDSYDAKLDDYNIGMYIKNDQYVLYINEQKYRYEQFWKAMMLYFIFISIFSKLKQDELEDKATDNFDRYYNLLKYGAFTVIN